MCPAFLHRAWRLSAPTFLFHPCTPHLRPGISAGKQFKGGFPCRAALQGCGGESSSQPCAEISSSSRPHPGERCWCALEIPMQPRTQIRSGSCPHPGEREEQVHTCWQRFCCRACRCMQGALTVSMGAFICTRNFVPLLTAFPDHECPSWHTRCSGDPSPDNKATVLRTKFLHDIAENETTVECTWQCPLRICSSLKNCDRSTTASSFRD